MKKFVTTFLFISVFAFGQGIRIDGRMGVAFQSPVRVPTLDNQNRPSEETIRFARGLSSELHFGYTLSSLWRFDLSVSHFTAEGDALGTEISHTPIQAQAYIYPMNRRFDRSFKPSAHAGIGLDFYKLQSERIKHDEKAPLISSGIGFEWLFDKNTRLEFSGDYYLPLTDKSNNMDSGFRAAWLGGKKSDTGALSRTGYFSFSGGLVFAF